MHPPLNLYYGDYFIKIIPIPQNRGCNRIWKPTWITTNVLSIGLVWKHIEAKKAKVRRYPGINALLFFYKMFVVFWNFRFSYLTFFSHIDMKKWCSEIGLWVSRVGARYLSQSIVFSYLYEKKMSNTHIENFKKSQIKKK